MVIFFLLAAVLGATLLLNAFRNARDGEQDGTGFHFGSRADSRFL